MIFTRILAGAGPHPKKLKESCHFDFQRSRLHRSRTKKKIHPNAAPSSSAASHQPPAAAAWRRNWYCPMKALNWSKRAISPAIIVVVIVVVVVVVVVVKMAHHDMRRWRLEGDFCLVEVFRVLEMMGFGCLKFKGWGWLKKADGRCLCGCLSALVGF